VTSKQSLANDGGEHSDKTQNQSSGSMCRQLIEFSHSPDGFVDRIVPERTACSTSISLVNFGTVSNRGVIRFQTETSERSNSVIRSRESPPHQ
jgi:hypothetical protein